MNNHDASSHRRQAMTAETGSASHGSLRVLISGGGLAGLSAGIALGRLGHAVTLVDLDRRVEGAQIGISARAVDALDELGVLGSASAASTVLMKPVFDEQFDEHGTQLPIPPMQIPPRPDGLPAMLAIYRPVLAGILESAAVAAGVLIRRPLTIDSQRFAAGVESVEFSDGTTGEFDLVVGAEGVHSPTRKRLFGESSQPRYVGSMSLRWTVREQAPGQGGFFHAPDGTTLIVGFMPGDMTYVATGVPMENRRVGAEESRALLADIFDRFDAPYLMELAERLDDEQDVIARPYESIRLNDDWFRGNTVIIGDAAHATTPNLSSGGGMALEDGVVLAQSMSHADDVSSGMEEFVRRRRPRTDLVVDSSLRLMELESNGGSQQEAAAIRMKAMGLLSQPY